MPIRLIATDLDDTVVRADKTIGPRTLDALRAARAAGLAVVPISGRHPFSIAASLLAPASTDP
jgi:hydroxymethylpyrimidine pyrophosphatase-like HAD family hydrolase